MTVITRFDIGEKVVFLADPVKRIMFQGVVVAISVVVDRAGVISILYMVLAQWSQKPYSVYEHDVNKYI